MKTALACAAAAICTVVATAHAAPAPDLTWMAGAWVQCGSAGAVTEEHWVGEGGDLVGVNRSRDRDGAVSWEQLRIGKDGDLPAYFASPQGAAATVFRLASSSQGSVVFENAANDFPKRIAYRREGDVLTAAATDLNGRGPVWRFRKKTEGAVCPDNREGQ